MRAWDGHARRARSAVWCLAPMIALSDSTDAGRRTGMYLAILSLCSFAGPLSIALLAGTQRRIFPFLRAFLYSSLTEAQMGSVLKVVLWPFLFFSPPRLKIHGNGHSKE
jgi:hypothetical protein